MGHHRGWLFTGTRLGPPAAEPPTYGVIDGAPSIRVRHMPRQRLYPSPARAPGNWRALLPAP